VLTYCVRRLLLALLLVWGVASGAFLLTRLAPGDATIQEGPIADPNRRQAERERLGLNRPILEHYVLWLGRAVRLDFGESVYYSRPVGELMRERAVNTAILATSALFLATLIGLPLGVYTATRQTGMGPALARAMSMLLLSTPPLIGSLVLVLLAMQTGWFPVSGMTSVSGLSGWPWLVNVIAHLPVPALALALPVAATLERLQSQSLVEVSHQPFLRATLARGVSRREALIRHAWPASLGPLLGIYGVVIGALFSGSFVVEVVTAWPGLGRLMVDGLGARDIYLVAGTAAAGAACLAAATFVTDVVHAAIDPRVRESR
jgi:ABC-type dipeptide/oligopeptide/nickel transport system permease component